MLYATWKGGTSSKISVFVRAISLVERAVLVSESAAHVSVKIRGGAGKSQQSMAEENWHIAAEYRKKTT